MPRKVKFEEDVEIAPKRFDIIPAYTVDISEAVVEVDAPDLITVESSFQEVKENDVKLLNLAATAVIHGISYVRTPANLVILTRELRSIINARRDALLFQKEKEPTLHNKNNVFTYNPID